MAVKRLKYFTGLFLQDRDFIDEQSYHLQMRRRLNFALFDPGVLFGLAVAREATDSVQIDPGMAVDRYLAQSRGREIVLSEARTVDLSGFANGDEIYITISYRETDTDPKPPTSSNNSRVTGEPLIEAFRDEGSGFTGDTNLKIILAKVTVGNLSAPNLSERQLAQIRLGGVAGPSPGPTITSVSLSAAARPGSSIVMTINGTNLGNSPAVTIFDNGSPDPNITAGIDAVASSDTALVVNLTIAPAAAEGSRRVRVQTSEGDATRSNAFTVIPPLPVITDISPKSARQTVTRTVTITGEHLDSPGGSTVVTVLRNSGVGGPVGVTATVNSVAGDGQSLSADLAIAASAAPGGRRIQVQAAGGTGVSSDDFFTVVPAPAIDSLLPPAAPVGAQIQVRGTNIRTDPQNSNANATTVRFVDPADNTNFAVGANPWAMNDTGTGLQRVRVDVPPKPVPDPQVEVNVVVIIEDAESDPVTFTYL